MSKTETVRMEKNPIIDINKLIRLILAVSTGDKTPEEATKEFADPYLSFMKVFAHEAAHELIKEAVNKVGMEGLSNCEFSDQLIGVSGRIVNCVRAYIEKRISAQEMVKLIGGSGIKEVSMQVLSALGIHKRLGLEHPEEILKLAPNVMAYNASIAAYKELRKALDDLSVAKERRKQIEEACRESVSMIHDYRKEMDRIVSQYLSVRLRTFESGFAAMDKALLEGDIDGYMRGNVEIQKILGYEIQFVNQNEFDELMGSESAFKL